jgi:hypothetical protein
MEATGGHRVPPLQLLPGLPAYSASIDSTFDALMEYVPKAVVANPAVQPHLSVC